MSLPLLAEGRVTPLFYWLPPQGYCCYCRRLRQRRAIIKASYIERGARRLAIEIPTHTPLRAIISRHFAATLHKAYAPHCCQTYVTSRR